MSCSLIYFMKLLIQCYGPTASYCVPFFLDHLGIANGLGTPLSDLSACCLAVVMCYIVDVEVSKWCSICICLFILIP
jgi:hypothetical protein